MATVMRKPTTFRLPTSVDEFLTEKANEWQTTKTDVLIEAVNCLRKRDIETLMAEGYREWAGNDLRIAQASLEIATESLPEW